MDSYLPPLKKPCSLSILQGSRHQDKLDVWLRVFSFNSYSRSASTAMEVKAGGSGGKTRLPIFVTRTREVCMLVTETSKRTPPVHHKHYLYWLRINPFWPHPLSKRQWRCPFWTTTRKGFWLTSQMPHCQQRPCRSYSYSKSSQGVPKVSSVVRISSLDTSSAMKFSPVYNEWEGGKGLYINFSTDYVIPESLYLSW